MAAGHFALVGMGIVIDEALVASATVSAPCSLEERHVFCGHVDGDFGINNGADDR